MNISAIKSLDVGDPDWILWNGGDGPPADDVVRVMLRSGEEYITPEPTDWRWRHIGVKGDIIAYRRAPEWMRDEVAMLEDSTKPEWIALRD